MINLSAIKRKKTASIWSYYYRGAVRWRWMSNDPDNVGEDSFNSRYAAVYDANRNGYEVD